tara:strand:- start:2319 stop:2576 length:258 start_codon:yes stop_codon:yes gene_type:complete
MIFTIYSKPGCPFCEKFKAVCELEELEHVVYELDKNFTKQQFYDEFGEGATYPQVVLDISGERLLLGGCQESLKYMQKENICCVV